MSFLTWLGKNTIGGYWNHFDKVDPWTLAEIEEDFVKDTKRASGVGVGGQTVVASQEVVQARISSGLSLIENHLLAQNQHPDQLGPEEVRKKILSDLKAAGALALGVWVFVEIAKAFISRR